MGVLQGSEALLSVNLGDDALNAKSAEAVLFVNMVDDALYAKSAEAVLFVSMGEYGLDAKSAEALLVVNMGDFALHAGAMVCAHMRGIFMELRKALTNNFEYCRRSRDPEAMP